MKILIITSCTGEKVYKPANQLVLEDFKRGEENIAKRELELADYITSAEQLYTGMQHTRLMRGVNKARETNEIDIDFWVVSAGYGLVPGNQDLAPYECTFTGMKVKEITDWASEIGIPEAVKQLLATKYDLALVLLGDSYLRACDIRDDQALGGPALFFTGKMAAKRLPQNSALKKVVLVSDDTRKFSCGLVGLKGEVVARVLENLSSKKVSTKQIIENPDKVVTSLGKAAPKKAKRPKARANPKVDQVIRLPDSWREKPHRRKLRYFIPEWDDLVDPDYDFEKDVHAGGTGDWSNEVYAHQMYSEPNYDGILISRAVAEKSKKKNERINAMGAHRFLRVPREFPIMGDCGAFDYIKEKVPPYTTDDVIDYYSRLDFDYGVSLDHLIVPAFAAEQDFRYELTINNAEEFLKEHKKSGLKWEPIGAVQGWDPRSYAAAVKKYQEMGYRSIALGGLVRSTTKNIYTILQEIKPILKPETQMHLFGIARPEALGGFSDLGVTSVDSASHLRRAWLVAKDNYFTLDGNSFSALRIPDVDKSYRAKRIVKEGKATKARIDVLERESLKAVHEFDKGKLGISKTLDILEEYDQLISDGRKGMREEYQRTLEATPWRNCNCAICKESGIEVMIFRGNNRNRRRGFHNTYVFYRLMQEGLLGGKKTNDGDAQLGLFQAVGVS